MKRKSIPLISFIFLFKFVVGPLFLFSKNLVKFYCQMLHIKAIFSKLQPSKFKENVKLFHVRIYYQVLKLTGLIEFCILHFK